MDATYDITCKRLPGMGSPMVYLKMMDADGTRNAPRATTRDFESSPDPKNEKAVQQISLTTEMRESRLPTCR